jgi:hypothetical protein
MRARFASLLALALAGSLTAAPALAETFDLLSYPFTFHGGAMATTGTLTTGFHGVLGDEASIEAFLNGATYSADLYGTGGLLTHLDNSNSHWDLMLSGTGASASLDVGVGGMLLSFSTPQEFSGARIVLRSLDGLSVLQYAQDNNNSNSNFVDFSYNAVYGAHYALAYGSTIALPIAAIPEPEVLGSLALGLVLMRWTMRKRRPSGAAQVARQRSTVQP